MSEHQDRDDKYRRYAKKVRIFENMSSDEIAEVLNQGKKLQFREGQTIFHEGMLGSNLFIVLSGEVAIMHKNEMIAKCSVGDAFGEMAVLNHEPRSATASALTDCKCFTLDEADMKRLLEKQLAVRLLLNIIHVLSERLESNNAYISKLKKQLGIKPMTIAEEKA